MPAVQAAADRENNSLRYTTTTAAFFSAVTATALQMSVTTNGNALDSAVNGMYFCALVLSTSSVVNGLTVSVWTRTFR